MFQRPSTPTAVVFRAFLYRQYSTTISDARDSHFTSRCSSTNVAVAKYLTPLAGGRPSGLSNPLATNMGISWGPNPKYQAVSSAVSRAGVAAFRFQELFSLGIHGLKSEDRVAGESPPALIPPVSVTRPPPAGIAQRWPAPPCPDGVRGIAQTRPVALWPQGCWP